MVLIEVAHGTAVADDEVLKAPLIAQDLLEQTGRTAAGVIIETLVGAHHLTYLGILYQCLEGRHIGLPEVACRHIGEVGRVTGVLRTTVYGIVLGTSPELAVSGFLRTLQAFDHLNTHDACQIGIFTVGLLTAAPAWVTEDVHVRCPYRQTAHLHVLAAQVVYPVVVLGTELGAGHVEHVEQ